MDLTQGFPALINGTAQKGTKRYPYWLAPTTRPPPVVGVDCRGRIRVIAIRRIVTILANPHYVRIEAPEALL